MNIDEPLRVISTMLADSGKLGLPVGPGRWHILFGSHQRPLLMPAGEFDQQKRWLPFFTGGGLRTLYAMTLLKLNAWMPAMGLLPELKVRGTVHPRAPRRRCPIRPDPRTPGPQAAIQIGTKGPYQKAAALLISEQGEGLALAKIALAESADPMVVAEANWLRTLRGMEDFSGDVPRLLAEGAIANGRRYVVTSLAPSTNVTTEFTAAHADFVGRLGRSCMEIIRFDASPCCEQIEHTLAEVTPVLRRSQTMQFQDALRDCRRLLRDHTGPFVFSQGDFAWWNIRVRPGGIFVFDWEYARRGANPLADLFHFHLIQRAAAGRVVSMKYLTSVMRRAMTFAREHYPESDWRAPGVSALALAYLLDVLLYYTRASGGFDGEERVMQGYWSLVERRSAWMAA